MTSKVKTAESEELDVLKIQGLPTPYYDAKSSEVKKYFAIGGSKYIGELGLALKRDWAKDISESWWKTIESNKLRLLMRRKLIDEWSNEHGNSTPWGENFIIANLAEFLKYPAILERGRSEAGLEKARMMREKALQVNAERYRQKIQAESKAIGKLVSQSADPPKEKLLKQEQTEPVYGTTPIAHEEEFATGREVGPTPIELYEDAVRALEKVWIPLTGERDLHAHGMDDVFLHHIKPTKNVRIKLVKGLDENRRIHLRNCAMWVKAVLEDVVRIDDEAAK